MRAASARSSSRAAIHQRSTRKNKPFVKVNCAALPAELLESELFGHEKGAFTGAATTRIGKFEQANFGTIFLDEIGEMKPPLQAKLLHVLQDAEFTKLGSNKKIEVDVRVVTATNRDLEAMMLRGQFREDLYYRLKVIEAVVPPLRERRDEINQLDRLLHHQVFAALQPPHARHFGRTAQQIPGIRLAGKHSRAREHDQAVRHPAGRAARASRVEQAATGRAGQHDPTGGRGSRVGAAGAAAIPVAADRASCPMPSRTRRMKRMGPAPAAAPATDGRRLVDVAREAALNAERTIIADTLRQVHWNRRKAAQLLGVSYKTLLNKIKETGLERP